MDTHLKLHAIQLKQLTQTETHPLHDLNAYLNPPRNMKATIFYNRGGQTCLLQEPHTKNEKFKEPQYKKITKLPHISYKL